MTDTDNLNKALDGLILAGSTFVQAAMQLQADEMRRRAAAMIAYADALAPASEPAPEGDNPGPKLWVQDGLLYIYNARRAIPLDRLIIVDGRDGSTHWLGMMENAEAGMAAAAVMMPGMDNETLGEFYATWMGSDTAPVQPEDRS